jgi:hypothetical protein
MSAALRTLGTFQMCSISNAGTQLASVQAIVVLTDCPPIITTEVVDKFVLLLLLNEA